MKNKNKKPLEEILDEITELKKMNRDLHDELKETIERNYNELRREYRTLNARVSYLHKKILHAQDCYSPKISVRYPQRGINSIVDPDYEKVDDFGPRPVYKKIKKD